MIALGLYAQAKEFLAVHGQEVEPPYRAGSGAFPAPRMDAVSAGAGHARGVLWASASPVAPEIVVDSPSAIRVSRVRPDAVRWRSQTAQ